MGRLSRLHLAYARVTVSPSENGLRAARQLLASGTTGAQEPAAVGAAIQRTLNRVSENLRQSIGNDGYEALISRAFACAQPEHPVLTDFRGDGTASFSIDHVGSSIDKHGVPVTTAALESLLAALVDVLSGLIGADMVLNLLDPDGQSLEIASTGEPR